MWVETCFALLRRDSLSVPAAVLETDPHVAGEPAHALPRPYLNQAWARALGRQHLRRVERLGEIYSKAVSSRRFKPLPSRESSHLRYLEPHLIPSSTPLPRLVAAGPRSCVDAKHMLRVFALHGFNSLRRGKALQA